MYSDALLHMLLRQRPLHVLLRQGTLHELLRQGTLHMLLRQGLSTPGVGANIRKPALSNTML